MKIKKDNISKKKYEGKEKNNNNYLFKFKYLFTSIIILLLPIMIGLLMGERMPIRLYLAFEIVTLPFFLIVIYIIYNFEEVRKKSFLAYTFMFLGIFMTIFNGILVLYVVEDLIFYLNLLIGILWTTYGYTLLIRKEEENPKKKKEKFKFDFERKKVK